MHRHGRVRDGVGGPVRALLVAALAIVALAGCGDDGDVVSAADARGDAYAYPAVDFADDPGENLERLRIPDDVLEGMSTPALVWSVLDFPYVGNAFASSVAGGEVDFLAGQCDALDALLGRDDAASAVRDVREEFAANGAAEDESGELKLMVLDLIAARVGG